MQSEVEKSPKETLRARGICVIIPTYNNVATISYVVMRALEQCHDVIVINDGSNDGTERILQTTEGITLLHHTRNRGKGAALKTALRYAKKQGYAYAITLDADGQHYPEDIPLLLQANIDHPGCLIVGQRQMQGVRRTAGSDFANKFSNFWFFIQTGVPLPDTQTGYRLYPLHKLYGLSLMTNRYEAELLIMVMASWHGVKLVSTPVGVYYPPIEDRVSHFRPSKDFARISVLNTCLCLLALCYALPLYIVRRTLQLLRTLYALSFYLLAALPILTPILWLSFLLCRTEAARGKVIHRSLNLIAKLVIKWHGIPGVQYTVNNPHREQYKKPAVVICNHQSHLDLMALLAETSNIVFLTNDWVWNSPYFGRIIRNAEYYPTSQGIDNIMPHLRDLAQRGYCIVVFPEGTRSKDCSIGRFHKGAFHIAKELELDILPLMLYGAGRVSPKGGRMLHKGHIHLEVLKRITPKEYNSMSDSTQGVARHMRHYYQSHYEALRNDLDKYA